MTSNDSNNSLTGRTLLVTGGASGIGRGLAEALHQLGNRVIIAGRRQESLDIVTSANPGMASRVLDVNDSADIQRFSSQIAADFPRLDGVIHSAGIMRAEDLIAAGADTAVAEATFRTNLLGPVQLNAALLPHLLKQSRALIMTVSSGLAFVPMATTPAYCASKAAIHSYTQSLRHQLLHTSIRVVELIPPYVRTSLMGERQATDAAAMPLDEFIRETMQILQNSPEAAEICVERVKPLRFAERSGDYDNFYRKFNAATAHR